MGYDINHTNGSVSIFQRIRVEYGVDAPISTLLRFALSHGNLIHQIEIYQEIDSENVFRRNPATSPVIVKEA